jgi:hypothetical protein
MMGEVQVSTDPLNSILAIPVVPAIVRIVSESILVLGSPHLQK